MTDTLDTPAISTTVSVLQGDIISLAKRLDYEIRSLEERLDHDIMSLEERVNRLEASTAINGKPDAIGNLRNRVYALEKEKQND